jgi:hypothetical protein
MKTILILTATLLSAGLFFGCATVPVDSDATDTAQYRFGNYDVQVYSGMDRLIAAADHAMSEMNYVQTDKKRTGHETSLRYRGPGDNLVLVKLKHLGNDRYNIRIRYGMAGHLEKSERVYEIMRPDI